MLDLRAINRATLERQLLLRRHDLPVLEAVRGLIALQAQLPNPPYLGLWARLNGFELDHLTGLMQERAVVRTCLLRGTLHVVAAEDFLELRPVVQAVLDRAQRGFFRRQTEGMDLAAFAAQVTELLEERPLTTVQLRDRLGELWPERNATALMQSVQFLVPTVHVPPGGTWGRAGSVPVTTVGPWLGRRLAEQTAPGPMILRYLASFGPATLKDVQAWSGLTRLKPHLDELRPQLTVERDPSGAELFDVPDAPRPDPDTPAPVRFLPEYDNLLVAYADRTRVISDEHRKITNTKNGMVAATVLVDGTVCGQWRIERGKGTATLIVRLFETLARRDREAVAEEGERLLAFAAADSPVRSLRFAAAL